MAIQLGLADFQFVHPTEMETIRTKFSTGTFDENAKPIIHDVVKQRRKWMPCPGAKIVISGLRVVSREKPVSITFEADESGRAICAVTHIMMPQLPMDCVFEAFGPSGLIERGTVRCGGNEATPITEIILKVA